MWCESSISSTPAASIQWRRKIVLYNIMNKHTNVLFEALSDYIPGSRCLLLRGRKTNFTERVFWKWPSATILVFLTIFEASPESHIAQFVFVKIFEEISSLDSG